MMKLLIGLRELIRFSYPFYISNRFNLWEVIVNTKVVNIRKCKYEVYIGRGSIYGNPFVIGKDGDRAEVIRKYANYASKFSKSQLDKLKGKVLGCYCKPLACHGDVLVNLIEKQDI